MVKFCEEELESLSLDVDEYYNIYKEVKKICRFTVKFKISNSDCSEVIKKLSARLGRNIGADVGDGLSRAATSFSIASGMSLAGSFQTMGRAMRSAGVSVKRAATLMAELTSAINNK